MSDCPFDNQPPQNVFNRSLPAEPFPPMATFGAGADEVENFARATGAPLGLTVNAVLAGHSAALPPGTRGRIDESWSEGKETNYFNAALPGANKTPLAEAIGGTHEQAGRLMEPAHEAEMAAHRKAQKVAKVHQRLYDARVKQAVEAGEEIPDPPPETFVPPEPELRRMVVTDASPEALKRLARHSPLYLLDEGDAVIGRVGTRARADLLTMNSGRGRTIDRITSGAGSRASFGGVTMLANYTTDRLAALLGGQRDGLVERCLVAFCDPVRQPRPDRHPDWEALAEGFFRLASWPVDPVRGRELRLSPEALALFNEFLEETQTSNGGGRVADYRRKANAQAIKLALALEGFHWRVAGCRAPAPTEISAFSMMGALALYEDFYVPMFARALALVSDDGDLEAGRVLGRWILESRAAEINIHALKYPTCAAERVGLPRDRIDGAVDALVAAGWLARKPHHGGKGAPAKTFFVNPLVHQEF